MRGDSCLPLLSCWLWQSGVLTSGWNAAQSSYKLCGRIPVSHALPLFGCGARVLTRQAGKPAPRPAPGGKSPKLPASSDRLFRTWKDPIYPAGWEKLTT